MRIQTLLLSFIIILVLVAGYTMITFKPKDHSDSLNYDHRVKKGQVWVKTDSLNPFKPIEIDTIVVLEVKKDYSLVLVDQDTFSLPSKWVTIDSKQIK